MTDTAAITEPRQLYTEQSAKLVEALRDEAPWKDQMWARAALTIAARTIRRGRLLTPSEKLKNIKWALGQDVP